MWQLEQIRSGKRKRLDKCSGIILNLCGNNSSQQETVIFWNFAHFLLQVVNPGNKL
uniref:Uncharacterized protein n=1 Tax=Arion vulgaris TaxID=1028688 RepID=A0A0B7AEU2_9EUPU